MKKAILIILLLFIITGCDDKLDESELTDNAIRGVWSDSTQLDNGQWLVNNIYFYGDNKCSLWGAITTNANSNGFEVIIDSICSYSVSGTNIYIDDTLRYIYDEKGQKLVHVPNSQFWSVKVDDDPCNLAYNHC